MMRMIAGLLVALLVASPVAHAESLKIKFDRFSKIAAGSLMRAIHFQKSRFQLTDFSQARRVKATPLRQPSLGASGSFKNASFQVEELNMKSPELKNSLSRANALSRSATATQISI